jgi:hypothetical protein
MAGTVQNAPLRALARAGCEISGGVDIVEKVGISQSIADFVK